MMAWEYDMKKIVIVAGVTALSLAAACTDRTDQHSNSSVTNDTVVLDNGAVATTTTNVTTTTKNH
jgi:hypothetical protein